MSQVGANRTLATFYLGMTIIPPMTRGEGDHTSGNVICDEEMGLL